MDSIANIFGIILGVLVFGALVVAAIWFTAYVVACGFLRGINDSGGIKISVTQTTKTIT